MTKHADHLHGLDELQVVVRLDELPVAGVGVLAAAQPLEPTAAPRARAASCTAPARDLVHIICSGAAPVCLGAGKHLLDHACGRPACAPWTSPVV